MKKAFFSAFLLFATPIIASEIVSEHEGRFRCRCLHEGCKEKTPDVTLLVDKGGNRLVINYGNETHSGAPARITHDDGSLTYALASGGKVSFSASGEMKFGWGKLWTCQRLP